MNKKLNYWLASFVMATLLVMLPFCSEGAPKKDQKDANKKENSESNGTNPGDGQSVTGKVGKYPYVDLGLPSGLLWATYNVGATSPEGYGDYFAWGETKPQVASDLSYSWETYKFMTEGYDSWRGVNKYTVDDGEYNSDPERNPVWYNNNGKFVGDSLTTLLPEDDAATANWGSAWRMPTMAEHVELREGCDWEWTKDYNGTGVAGRIGTSKTNGNTIFLPAAGYRDYVGYYGDYWSSSLSTDGSSYAYELSFRSYFIDWLNNTRRSGFSVRAVSGK